MPQDVTLIRGCPVEGIKGGFELDFLDRLRLSGIVQPELCGAFHAGKQHHVVRVHSPWRDWLARAVGHTVKYEETYTFTEDLSMPLTPLHYPVAYALHRLAPSWSLPGFIVGAMVPDLEIPVIVGLYGLNGIPGNRLVLHSLVGGVTLGTLLSVLLVVLVAQPVLLRLLPLCRGRVRAACRRSRRLVMACSVGALSHVALDVASHPVNPVWWPFSNALLENPYGAVAGPLARGLHVGLLVVGMVLLWRHRRQLPDAILGSENAR